MNVFIAKFLMYHDIQRLHAEGYSLVKISSIVGANRRTVKRYLEMTEKEFEAFQNRNIYTFSSQKGETGGVLFYEMAPNRPDLVLKDLISIFHPELLPDYETTFYKPLE